MKTFNDHIKSTLIESADKNVESKVKLIVSRVQKAALDALKAKLSSSGFAFPTSNMLWEPCKEHELNDIREFIESSEKLSLYPSVVLFSKNLADEIFKDSRMNVFSQYQFIVALHVYPDDDKNPCEVSHVRVKFKLKPQCSSGLFSLK